MASRIDPAIKERLEADGTWVSFHVMRRRLIHEGKDPDEAEAIALKKFSIPMEAAGLRVTPPGSNRKDGMTTGEVKAQGAAFRKQTQEEARVPRSVFTGKSCSFREEVQWVADNLVIRAVKPKDAPSSSAWGLFLFARHSIGNEIIFRDKFHAKIHQAEIKSESDDESPFKDDGREIIDTIEALRAAGQ